MQQVDSVTEAINALAARTQATAAAVAAAASDEPPPPPPPPPLPARSGSFPAPAGSLVGQRVLMQGLVARADLNSTFGRAISYDEASGRYTVELLDGSSGQTITLKPENVKHVPPPPPPKPRQQQQQQQQRRSRRRARVALVCELSR